MKHHIAFSEADLSQFAPQVQEALVRMARDQEDPVFQGRDPDPQPMEKIPDLVDDPFHDNVIGRRIPVDLLQDRHMPKSQYDGESE